MKTKNRCMVIADVAQAHDGSLGTAHAFIEAAAEAGVDAIKFQTHIADEESTPAEPWRVKFSRQDDSRFEYWKRMEFTDDQWLGLKKHAEEKGLIFLSTPFSLKAYKFLKSTGIRIWKIASGEITNKPLLERIFESGDLVLLSTGMSTYKEIDEAIDLIRKFHNNFALLQCTTRYPCPMESIGLNNIEYFKDKYGCSVGLSDHSGKVFPGIAAQMLGIEFLEVHITLSKYMFGPDVSSSLTPEELKFLIQGIRYTESMLANPVDKDSFAATLLESKKMFQKGVVAIKDILEGEIITEEHISVKKPMNGIPAKFFGQILGMKAVRPISSGEFVLPEFIENGEMIIKE